MGIHSRGRWRLSTDRKYRIHEYEHASTRVWSSKRRSAWPGAERQIARSGGVEGSLTRTGDRSRTGSPGGEQTQMVRGITIAMVAGEPTLVFWRVEDLGEALDAPGGGIRRGNRRPGSGASPRAVRFARRLPGRPLGAFPADRDPRLSRRRGRGDGRGGAPARHRRPAVLRADGAPDLRAGAVQSGGSGGFVNWAREGWPPWPHMWEISSGRPARPRGVSRYAAA